LFVAEAASCPLAPTDTRPQARAIWASGNINFLAALTSEILEKSGAWLEILARSAFASRRCVLPRKARRVQRNQRASSGRRSDSVRLAGLKAPAHGFTRPLRVQKIPFERMML
jgi:hypothetical protein